jgi:hypothetical protein
LLDKKNWGIRFFLDGFAPALILFIHRSGEFSHCRSRERDGRRERRSRQRLRRRFRLRRRPPTPGRRPRSSAQACRRSGLVLRRAAVPRPSRAVRTWPARTRSRPSFHTFEAAHQHSSRLRLPPLLRPQLGPPHGMGEDSSSSFIPTAALFLYPLGPSGIPLIPCPECGDEVVERKSWKNNGRVFFKCINYDESVSILINFCHIQMDELGTVFRFG